METVAEGVVLSSSLVEPSSGNDPALGGTTAIGFIGVTGVGQATVYYDEVGIIEISSAVTDNNYLGIGTTETAKILGDSGQVGRFTPYGFAVAKNSPALGTVCAAGLYSYMGWTFAYRTDPVPSGTAGGEEASLVGPGIGGGGVRTVSMYTGPT